LDVTIRPPFKRRRVGRRLREMRLRAGLTLEEAAPRLDTSRTSLNRIELGEYRASVHLIRSMMDLYDCYVEGLLDEAREALKQPWYPQYNKNDMGYVGLEDEAVLVRTFCGLNLPGLVQTERYIRALFEGCPHLMPSPTKIEEQVAVRLFRQRRLRDTDNPLEMVAFVDEAALHREVGGTDVMREQLKHMVEAAALSSVTLQVLPYGCGAHGAMNGGFTLLSFSDFPEMLYAEYATGSLHIESKEQIQLARQLLDLLRSRALSPADSVAFIEHVSTEFDER